MSLAIFPVENSFILADVWRRIVFLLFILSFCNPFTAVETQCHTVFGGLDVSKLSNLDVGYY